MPHCYFLNINTRASKSIRPINPAPLRHLLVTNHDDSIQYVNAFLQITKSEETNETFWFPSLQELGDEAQHTPIQKRILQERMASQKLEQLNPQENEVPRK